MNLQLTRKRISSFVNLQSIKFDPPALTYFVIVNLSGFIIIFFTLRELNIKLLPVYLIWTIFSVACELRQIHITPTHIITISMAIYLSSLILFGIPTAILIVATSTIIADFIEKKNFYKIIFNACQYTISIYLAGLLFYSLKRSSGVVSLGGDFWAILSSSFLFALVNFMLVVLIISLTQKTPFREVARQSLVMQLIHFVSLVPLSLSIAFLYLQEPLAVLFLFFPIVLAYLTLQNYVNLQKEIKRAMEIIADIIDLRDPYTSSHSLRVSQYAAAIAKEINLPSSQVEDIYLAGRVHDLGKIGISDYILQKPEELSIEETEIMKEHPRVAYSLLNNLQVYKRGAKYVYYHHEKIDGSGYPKGLSEENIPLGAKILSVADSYDAMTSDRPYRKALSSKEAIKELQKGCGKQFDRNVVEAFIRVLNKK